MVTSQNSREQEYNRRLRREQNALTIMPLPVRILIDWYNILPIVFPLISNLPEDSAHYIDPQILQDFIRLWKGRLMNSDGQNAWINLGGIECYETIPSFAQAIESKIQARDSEAKADGGLKAAIDLWRTHIKSLGNLDDMQVLAARKKFLGLLESIMSTITLSGCWAEAFQNANENIIQLRPQIERWIEENESLWDLDLPFGGKIAPSTTDRLS